MAKKSIFVVSEFYLLLVKCLPLPINDLVDEFFNDALSFVMSVKLEATLLFVSSHCVILRDLNPPFSTVVQSLSSSSSGKSNSGALRY